jgi:hypothetical protein
MFRVFSGDVLFESREEAREEAITENGDCVK